MNLRIGRVEFPRRRKRDAITIYRTVVRLQFTKRFAHGNPHVADVRFIFAAFVKLFGASQRFIWVGVVFTFPWVGECNRDVLDCFVT